MRSPSTLALVVRRALANPAPVVSVALNVLVVCTLVSGLAASLTLLQQDALGTALAAEDPDATVLTVTAPYDDEAADRQDRLVRDALAPVVEVAGGTVVTLAESGSHDLVGGEATEAGWTFAAVTGDSGGLRFGTGAAPAPGSGPLEVAAPATSDLAVGDEVVLVNRSDDSRVEAVVTGTWDVTEDGGRGLADLDPTALVVAPARFGEVAGTSTLVHWRAVPDLARLAPADLPEVVSAVATAETEVAAAGDDLGGSLQTDTGLVEAMTDRARELTVLRALLLVPAGLLVLVAAAGLVLVAAGLADVRREEESLLRSRGAGYRQLAGPTLLETLLLCGVAAAVAPPLASGLVRIGDVRPPLDGSAWRASAAAAAVCAVALSVPVALRALTGDRGQQLNVEKQRRRALTALVATVLLVAALAGLAVVELRGFGESVAATTVTSSGVDPLLIASPALLLLGLAVVASVLLLPLWFRLVATLLGPRGVSASLGSRFAARAPRAAVPLALTVALASGTIAFAAVERASSAEARVERASYVAGADVRVTTPPAAQRAGVDAERALLLSLPGVAGAAAVHRGDSYLDDLPAEILMTRLSAATADDLLGGGTAWQAAVRPPAEGEPAGTAVPVVMTRKLAADASLAVGDTVSFAVLGIPTPVELVATVPNLRTVEDGSGGVLLDTDTALPALRAAGYDEEPDEWWLDVRPGREPEVADALAEHPEVAADVVTRDEMMERFDDDPSTGGAALGEVLVLTALGCLLVGALLLFSVALLRRRERSEQARMLTAAGADRRHLAGVLAWEHALVAGSGLTAGVLAGGVVAATTLVSMTLGPDGRLLVPAPELVLPWAVLLVPAAMVAVPLLAMVWLARRDHGRAMEVSGPGRRGR